MTDIGKTLRRYRDARREMEQDEQMVKVNLLFGAGVLMGGDFPGASAAVILMLERMFPDEKWPDFGADGQE